MLSDPRNVISDLPSQVTSVVHLCCGYPTYLDQDDYLKADKDNYSRLAELLDNTGVSQVSIENAEAKNDLEVLLPKFKRATIVLGTVAVARRVDVN